MKTENTTPINQFLEDPRLNKEAARQLSSRIREVNRAAKAAATRTEREHKYFLKARLVSWGLSDFGFKIISWEYDSHLGVVVLCRLRDRFRSTVHVPLKDLTARLNLKKLRRQVTLKQGLTRKPGFGAAQPAFG